MVDLPNIKNYPKETKRIYLIICIFAAFLNKRLANKMKKGLFTPYWLLSYGLL